MRFSSIRLLRPRSNSSCAFAGVVLFCSFLAARPGFAQTDPDTTAPAQLELGKRLQREISGGRKHSIRIDLEPGEFARLTIEQKGIDVFVRVLEPGGKQITEFDSEIRVHGLEKVELSATTGGSYAVEIEPRAKTAEAGIYEAALLEKRPSTERDRELQEARVLADESRKMDRNGDYKKALALAEQVLAIRERNLGANDPEVGMILIRIGNLHYSLGESAKAEPLYERALVIYEAKLGTQHPSVADPLNNLAVLSRVRGELVEAEKMFLRVISIREKALGPDHPSIASNLNNLAITYRRRGETVQAEAAYARALDLRERSLGRDHLDVAGILFNLANLRAHNGDYAAAAAYDERTLAIREKNLGPDHPQVASALTNLGDDYINAGDYEKARSHIERSLAIREKRLGPEHLDVADSLADMAKLHSALGDREKAKVFLLRAIDISERNEGRDMSDFSDYLGDLGVLYARDHDFERAETYLTRALALREKIYGPEGYGVGRVCRALAQMYALKGDAENALRFQMRSTRVNEKAVEINLSGGTEHQKLSYMKLLSDDLNQAIFLGADLARGRPEARVLAATELVQQKGRVLDAMAASLAALRSRIGPEDQLLFERLNDVNSGLAELYLDRPDPMASDEYDRRVERFRQRKEKLEREIGVRSLGYHWNFPSVTLKGIAASIAPTTALVEFVLFKPLVRDGNAADPVFGKARYAAFVIRSNGVVEAADLGPARDIDEGVEAFRSALRDARRGDTGRLGSALNVRVIEPVLPFLTGVDHLLISPDGALNLIPFEALVNSAGKHLIEDYSITYLTSARDLARLQVERKSRSEPVVVANPDFGHPGSLQNSAANLSRNGKRQSITTTRNLSDTYFAPLNATQQEGAAIKALFPGSLLITGVGASEGALRRINAPKILHIATHGFFLYEREGGRADLSAKNAHRRVENPLLRSGLALAGANRRAGGEDDGILTALEASGLDLWGTKLVVLSACDTGVGEVRNGEGVYGLRRSFVLAGAESLVMSLWPVSDHVTRELMGGYYKNLKQGLGRGESLRRVQLEMLKSSNRRHPFYWASFIQSGEWANLDGKR